MSIEISDTIPITAVPQPDLLSAHTVVRTPAAGFLISDEFNHRILSLSPAGECLGSIGGPGIRPGEFRYPRGLALVKPSGGEDLIVVCDAWNHRIQVLTLEGRFVSSFGSLGAGREDFYEPSVVHPYGDGCVAVLDRCNHRVKLCTLAGETVAVHGRHMPERSREFFPDPIDWLFSENADKSALKRGYCYPSGLAVTACGALAVADTNNHRISVFNPADQEWHVIELGGPVGAPHSYPEAVAALQEGTIAILAKGDAALWLVEEAPPHRVRRLPLPDPDAAWNRPAMVPENAGTLLMVDGLNKRIARCRIPRAFSQEAAAPPAEMSLNEAELWFEYFQKAEQSQSVVAPLRRYLGNLKRRALRDLDILVREENDFLQKSEEYWLLPERDEKAACRESPGSATATSRPAHSLALKRAEKSMAGKRRLFVQSLGLPALLLGSLPEAAAGEKLPEEAIFDRLLLEETLLSRSADYERSIGLLRAQLAGISPEGMIRAGRTALGTLFLHQQLRCLTAALNALPVRDAAGPGKRQPPGLPSSLHPYQNRYSRLVEEVHLSLGFLCLEWGLRDSARAILEYRSRRCDPVEHKLFLIKAAVARRTAGANEEALVIFDMIDESATDGLTDAQRRDFFAEKGHALFFLGRPRAALQCYLKAGAGDPEVPFYVGFHAGVVCEQLGRFDEALRFYRPAVEKGRTDPIQHEASATALVRALYLSGAFAEAAESLASLPPELKQKSFFINVAGSCLQHQAEENAGALPALEKLLESHPDCAGLRLNLAVRLALGGDIEASLENVEAERGRFPEAVIGYVKGMCLRIAGCWAEAMNTFTGVEEIEAFPAVPLELLVAAFGTGAGDVIERGVCACASAAGRNPVLNGFLLVPSRQKRLALAAIALLEQRLDKRGRVPAFKWVNSSTLKYALVEAREAPSAEREAWEIEAPNASDQIG